PADSNRGRYTHEGPHAGHRAELLSELGHDLFGAARAFGARLQAYVHAAEVRAATRAAGAHRRHERRDIGVTLYDAGNLLLLLDQLLERDALNGFAIDVELIGVLGRKEPFWDLHEQPGSRGQRHEREAQRQAPLRQRPGEG